MTSTHTAPLWIPSDHNPENTMLARLKNRIEALSGQHFGGTDQAAYTALNNWAVQNPEKFWSGFWDFADLLGDKGEIIIEEIPHVPWARFFPDSKINYTENILRHAMNAPDAPAIIARLQGGPDRVMTGRALCDQVSLWQQALEKAGLQKGDRIAAYLPNIPETIIVFLAAANIGAVFSSAGMEMGPGDLINRLTQVRPKILVAGDGYVHGKKSIDRREIIARAQSEIPGIEQTILINIIGETYETIAPHKTIAADDFLKSFFPKKLIFPRHAFNHPLYILFSSGSTGKPKCFEHSTGGILLKHLSEQIINSDIKPGDCVFYHATPSWMMWNWLITALACGASILLYDGNPAYPGAAAQWDFTALHKCTHHGTAAPVILSWEKSNLEIGARFNLSPLRVVLSTGAVLPKQGFEFIHRNIKPDVKIASISGGTDIVGCFLGGNPFTPTYAGQVNGPMIGCDIKLLDDDGNEKSQGTGELVCANPFPSMPLRFLDDEDGARYRAEYFDHYPGRHLWRHGDTLEKTRQGQFIIIGRSDATLNQNGVRIGPSAIYDQLTPFMKQINDAAAVDFTRPDNKQTITILFLALDRAEKLLDPDLQTAIRNAIKDNVTPYAVPTEIIAVPGILTTPNGKKAEIVIKKIINGQTIPNASLYGETLVKFYEEFGQTLKIKYGG